MLRLIKVISIKLLVLFILSCGILNIFNIYQFDNYKKIQSFSSNKSKINNSYIS